jgi:hypothetical protein
MKPRLLICIGLAMVTITSQGQSNLNSKDGSYYSWQNPQWPPMPGPISTNLPVYRLVVTNLPGTNNFLVDDREVVYSAPPARKDGPQPTSDEDLARNPEALKHFRAVTRREEERAWETRDASQIWLARHYRERLTRLESLAKVLPPQTYSSYEKFEMTQFILLGELARTNREAFAQGKISMSIPNVGGFSYQGSVERVERLAPLARFALTNNTAEATAAFRQAKTNRTQQP